MLPKFLLEETIAQADGFGPELPLGAERAQLAVLTLGITRIVERANIQISVWGSGDRVNWGVQPLALFPPKSYCGMYSILLNLAARPDVQYLRVHWKVSRWGRKNAVPMFGFYVFVEASGARIRAAVA